MDRTALKKLTSFRLSELRPISYDSQPSIDATDTKSSHISLLENHNGSGEPVDAPHLSQHRINILSPHGWLYEVSSLFVAAASFVALVLVLRKYQNKPSPQWPADISLNTLVSVVSTVFRATLLMPVATGISQSGWIWFSQRSRPLEDICHYDSASRGPIGSIKLLFRLKFVHLASLGAVITLATLALDPFFQQSIKYEPKSAIDLRRQAETVAAYDYNGTIGRLDTFSDAFVNLPYSLKAAMYSGLLSSNLVTLPVPPFSCPSGNCTWDPFATLSVSSQCVDITSNVKLNCTGGGLEMPDGCNFAALNDPILAAMLKGSTKWNPMIIEASIALNTLAVLKPYANITGFLSSVQWVKVTRRVITREMDESSWITPNATFEAVRCIFYLSVQEIRANVSNGVYMEEVLQEYSHIENTTAPPTYSLNGTNYYFRDPWDWVDDLVFQPKFAHKPPNQHSKFTVPFFNFDMLSSQLVESEFLQGNLSTSDSGGLYGPDITLMLFLAPNVTRAMHNMAQYMTTSLRANDSLVLQNQRQDSSLIAPSQSVKGTVWVQTQFVTVRWAWLILPFVLLILALVFLISAVSQTRGSPSDIGLWKSSPLTLFFHAQVLGSEEGGQIQNLAHKAASQGLNTVTAMQSAAAGIGVQVEHGAGPGAAIKVFPARGNLA